ncbi:MAG: hypothetical protein IKE22_10375, partial [Atopobiaceae bacterium]|nr:hypothetical protein [Atopobiaceae bacterium]
EIEAGKRYKLVLSMGRVVVDPESGKKSRPRRAETFDGTLKQAIARMEGMHKERDLLNELADMGLDMGKLSSYGLSEKAIFSMRLSAREVANELDRRKAEAEAKAAAKDHKPTLAEVSDAMLTEIEEHARSRKSGEPLTNRTKADYRLTERHILSTGIGDKPVEEINEADVLGMVSSLRSAGKGEPTVHKAFVQMRRVLEYARKRMRLIAFNPVDALEENLKPKRPPSERKDIGASEWARMVKIVVNGQPNARECAVLIAACNGLRIGECLGLSWGDVHLDEPIPYLLVHQQYTELDGIHKTKTKNGHKTPLDALTVAYLKKWKAAQSGELNALGIEIGPSTPVCTNSECGTIGTNNFEKWWRRWCVDNGFATWVSDDGRRVVDLTFGLDDPDLYPADDFVVEWRDLENWPCDETGRRYSRTYKRPKVTRHYNGITPHQLRHSFFTLRAADTENPISVKELQYLGGWTTPRMVMEIYAHSDEARAMASGGMADRLLGASENTAKKRTA